MDRDPRMTAPPERPSPLDRGEGTDAGSLLEQLRSIIVRIQQCKRGELPISDRPVIDAANILPAVVQMLELLQFERDLAWEEAEDIAAALALSRLPVEPDQGLAGFPAEAGSPSPSLANEPATPSGLTVGEQDQRKPNQGEGR